MTPTPDVLGSPTAPDAPAGPALSRAASSPTASDPAGGWRGVARLFGAELHRIWLRSFVRVGVLVVLVGLLANAAILWRSAQPPSAADLAAAQASYEIDHDSWEEYIASGQAAADIADCEADRVANPDDWPAELDCTDMTWTEPQLEWYLTTWQLTLGSTLPGNVEGLGMILALGALLVAASLVTAEMTTGSMTTWLTYEPRRSRVFATKTGAAVLASAALAAMFLVVLTATVAGALWLADPATLAPGLLEASRQALPVAARAIALVTLLTGLGTALGFLLRQATWVFGVVIGYLILVEATVGTAWPELSPWLLGANMTAWSVGGTTYYVEECRPTVGGGTECYSVDRYLSQAHGGVYLAVVVAAMLVLAWLAFRRRDVE